jgi:hypothetical protein
MIDLILEPSITQTWEVFCSSHDPFSIAIDGRVFGGPKFDPTGPRANFNHHEEVDRLATRCTCAQILMAIRQGLFRTFRYASVPKLTVYANDCDQDVCTSWFLLANHYWAEQPLNPLLNRLVMLEDMLDTTAGAYPLPVDLPVLREMAWVFDPYTRFRSDGGLSRQNAKEFKSVIEDVAGRIGKHITGSGEEMPLDLRYERIGGGTGWTMVKEVGAQSRTAMFADGIRAYVSATSVGDRWKYTLGRMSPFIPFDIPAIYKACNEVDGGGWSGSDIVGGSPRGTNSKIEPKQISEIVERVRQ